eukprot:jgi/Psemu1/285279/fgenesh1_pg.79_\
MFVKYVVNRVQRALSSGNQDMGVALALYVVYPAILWLIIDKFHGVCGFETYAAKQEAIAANKSVFLWFTGLMRTYKLASILFFQADASDKEEDPEVERLVDGGGPDDEGCTKQKCRVWFILSQELIAILCVVFLLLVCLPVLAFWFMFIGACVSFCNICMLSKRLWRDAHTVPLADNVSILDESRNGDEIEFEEFLNNFAGDANEVVESSTLDARPSRRNE